LVIKGWDRLVQPHLWAEDGAVYFQESLSNPWLSVFQQFGGYFQVVQRLAIHVLALFPLAWLPALIVLTSYLLYAGFAAQFARPAFRDYVPSDSARVVTSAMLVFLPGLAEVAGNYANIFRPIFLFTWFVALKPPRYAIRTWELVALALFVFSAGQVIFIVPLLAFRLFYQVREQQERSVVRREVAAILVVVLGGILSALQPTHPSVLPPSTPNEVVSTTTSLIPRVTVYQPWLGPRWTNTLADNQGVLLWFVGVGILGGIVWLLLKRRGLAGRQLLLGMLAVAAIWPLTFMIRPEATQLIREAPDFWNTRYGYQMAPFAVILWATILLYRFPYQKGSRLLAAVFVVLYLVANQGYSTIRAYGTGLDWQADLAQFELVDDTGCPPEAVIPIYPRVGVGPGGGVWGVRFPGEPERCLVTLTEGLEDRQLAPDTTEARSVISIDAPGPGALVGSSFLIGGWAIDDRAESGTGVEDAHIWALPTSTGEPIFLGRIRPAGDRPDVGGVFGAQFADSGYTLIVNNVPPGTYDLVVAAYSSVTDSFDVSESTRITVRPDSGP
jgi:hypothetical protein